MAYYHSYECQSGDCLKAIANRNVGLVPPGASFQRAQRAVVTSTSTPPSGVRCRNRYPDDEGVFLFCGSLMDHYSTSETKHKKASFPSDNEPDDLNSHTICDLPVTSKAKKANKK